jgi:hypothetical protein
VFGSCVFLSFSLVFCLLGSRFEASLYIHFTQRWVKSTRRSSARRGSEDEKKSAERNAVLRSAGFEVGEGALSKEGWPKYYVGLKDCALVVRFGSADFGNIERTAP